MKYVKMLGLLAVAAAALMAFAGTASATNLTSPEGTTYTGEITATSSNSELDGAFVTVKCHSHIQGHVTSHGGTYVHGHIDVLQFTGCNYTTTVTNAGSITIHKTSGNVVTSTGAEVSIATSVGTCVFTTNGTSVGSLTEGTNASLDIASAKIPRTGGNFLCGSSGTWTGSYDLVTPNNLWVD